MSIQNLAYAKKRRSSRIDHAIPLTVGGADAFRAPYMEHVSTLTISCHGCRYESKYDVLPGDVVFLEVDQAEQGHKTCTFRGRVKFVQRLMAKDRPFEIAVELERPGNIWGVSFPPEDWFPAQKVEAIEPANGGQKQAVVSKPKQQTTTVASERSVQVSRVERNESAVPLSPLLEQLVTGLGEQIRAMASEAAAAAILKEKGRLLDEFRSQLQSETARTLEQALSTSKEELARGALNDVKKAYEAAARTTHEHWMKKVEQDLAIATEGMLAQKTELSQSAEGMATTTIERLQRHMDALRRDSIDQFLSRLREQLAPLLKNAESALQRLAAHEHKIKEKTEASCVLFEGLLQQTAQRSVTEAQEKILRFEKQIEKQIEKNVSDRLSKAHDELDKKWANLAGGNIETVRKLSEDYVKAADARLQSLSASATDHITRVLKQKTGEIAAQFAAELEGNTRSYLESVSASIAEIPRKVPIRRRN